MENSKNKKKCYEVTYHFTNGEVKSVDYNVDSDNSKQEFMQYICSGYANCNNKFLSDEKLENVVNINYVCFFEVREFATDGVVYTDKLLDANDIL